MKKILILCQKFVIAIQLLLILWVSYQVVQNPLSFKGYVLLAINIASVFWNLKIIGFRWRLKARYRSWYRKHICYELNPDNNTFNL